MTALTNAIVFHDLAAIESTVAADRTLIHQPEQGWLPIEWAKRTGNFVTLTRVYRVLGKDAPEFAVDELLSQYLQILGDDEYEPYSPEQTAQLIWECLYEGKNHKVGRWKGDLIPTEGQAEDLRFLIERAGHASVTSLVRSVRG